MDARIAEFADCKINGFAPESQKAQALAKEWKDFVTENYYTFTKEILAGLGKIYVSDERFRENIDRHGAVCERGNKSTENRLIKKINT